MSERGGDRAAWISEEPTLASVSRRVLARGVRRPVLVVAVAAAATAALGASRAFKHPTYEATLDFRLEEGYLASSAHEPSPPRDIRQQIASVALSRQQLETIMNRHRLSQAWLARDRAAAVEAFREDIEVSVERNYFIYDRRPDDPPRSAHVAISLAGADEERTRAMLRDVGDSILRSQEELRGVYLRESREAFGAQLEEARARRSSLEQSIAALAVEASNAGPREALAAKARIAALQVEALAAIRHEAVLEKRAAEVAFGATAERARLGTRFDLVDERVAVFAPRLSFPRLALRAVVTFAILTVLAALAAGAFDDRLYTVGDLAAWDLPVFGALPRFPGDEVASYRARSERRAPRA